MVADYACRSLNPENLTELMIAVPRFGVEVVWDTTMKLL